MKQDIKLEIPLDEGVQLTLDDQNVTVTSGDKTIKKPFRFPRVKISVNDNTVTLFSKNATKREKVIMFTVQSHIKNMMRGVVEGFEYKLKICAGFFPMTVNADKGKLVVKNFIGEKVPREVTLYDDVDVNIDGDIVTVTGIDKERVGQCAANIERLCKRSNFDNRIYQDGIYIISKAGKDIA